MGLLWSLALSIQFLLLSLLFSSKLTNCSPFVHHPTHECHEDESYALLHFKECFFISKYASLNPFSYPKTVSWMSSTDCCSWDGIKCDDFTGHVIGIDLSSSQLYGSMDANSSLFSLVHLQRLDLSDNDFNHSQIPSSIDTFKNWKSMTTLNVSQLKYEAWEFYYGRSDWFDHVSYSFTISNKGVAMDYEGLQHSYFMMVAIDLSSNRISGEIPDVLGDLKSLILLNLSNNMLSGNIPSSLGKLSNLETLDLSLNRLLGKIPQQLTELTFLEFFNVSFNNLSGAIPENKQFSTFEGNSFQGNQDLCGIQLSKKCEDHARSSLPKSSGDQGFDSGCFFEFDWKIILTGYGGGLVAGLALGNAFSSDIIRWLSWIF